MSGVRMVTIDAGEGGQRLDRWLRSRYPNLKQGKLQKLLRTGQVRLDGARAKAGDRVSDGQEVRIPPNIDVDETTKAEGGRGRSAAIGGRMDMAKAASLGDDLKDRILYQDDDIIALDKPPGLAVQGGSKTVTHIDGALDRLKFGAKERPRLVHRLDRDTSGVLLLARSRAAAAAIGKSFQLRETRKIYWAVVIGVPDRAEGMIDAPLAKRAGDRGDMVQVDHETGKPAKTGMRIIDRAGKEAAWLELEPLTGRTHQLRVHCQLIGTPILGDGKYGPRETGLYDHGIQRKLHLHARMLRVPLPSGGSVDITAPLPPHMIDTFQHLGFHQSDEQAEIIDL